MRKLVDVMALERELENRLDVLNADTVFMSSGQAPSKLNGLIERLELVRLIKKNFEVIEWFGLDYKPLTMLCSVPQGFVSRRK